MSNLGKKIDMIISTISKLSPIPGRENEVGYIVNMPVSLEYEHIILVTSALQL